MPEELEWWSQEPFKTSGPLSDYFDIPAIIAEAQRRERERMRRLVESVIDGLRVSWDGNPESLFVNRGEILRLIDERGK